MTAIEDEMDQDLDNLTRKYDTETIFKLFHDLLLDKEQKENGKKNRGIKGGII